MITTMSDEKYALVRAAFATAAFAAVAVIGVLYARVFHSAWPLVTYYAITLVHTFLSIRVFSMIIPYDDALQNQINGLLVITYLLLPFFFGSELAFIAGATVLMALASVKYAVLPSPLGISHIVRRKIVADTLGTLLNALSIMGLVLGYRAIVIPVWIVIFALGSGYYFFARPLYALKQIGK